MSFNTCSSCEEQHDCDLYGSAPKGFNTCSSCEEQLEGETGFPALLAVSIHAPLARSNSSPSSLSSNSCSFQYMLLLRGATIRTCRIPLFLRFQYMLLLRGATPMAIEGSCCVTVSIHAPLARSNYFGGVIEFGDEVSIHAPLARSNYRHQRSVITFICFNTCSSCEEQLAFRINSNQRAEGFNTCSSCEEQHQRGNHQRRVSVSIHAPLARSNKATVSAVTLSAVSIHAPLARSNTVRITKDAERQVSIHAPLARSNFLQRGNTRRK